MLQDCIFCKIVAGEIPAERVYEDDAHVAFVDIQPKAPVHFLVIPKAHSDRLDTFVHAEDDATVGRLVAAAVRTAEQNQLTDYRIGVNVGKAAGQEVFHTHVHVLGGWASGDDA